MHRRPVFSRSLLAAGLVAAALTCAPAGPAHATAIPDPTTQYQLATYHYGSIQGYVIGQYAYPGPCGDAFWWGDTSQWVTTSWVTCPGH